MKASENKINKILNKQITKTLAGALCDFKTPEKMLVFLKDFFTQKELELFAKRLAVAYWLKKKRDHKNIKTNLKVSSSTISTIKQQINSPGFKLALKTIEAEEWANQWAEKIKKFVK